jgi:hypothetical protein
MKACADPASRDWRIMTPTFVHTSDPAIDATRATMAPSPASGRHAK